MGTVYLVRRKWGGEGRTGGIADEWMEDCSGTVLNQQQLSVMPAMDFLPAERRGEDVETKEEGLPAECGPVRAGKGFNLVSDMR